jgi:hypothetical protein
MPNWKKVIVSGSDAALNSLIVTSGVTGSLLGTASTASFVTGSNVYGPFGSNSILSSSYAVTASLSTAATANYILVLNQSGNTISKGVVVHITASGNSSDIPRIMTASYENDSNSANTLGITSEAITNGSTGYVTTEGVLLGINTSAFISGQLVYLGATGSIIGTAPQAPLHSVRLGQVVRDQSNNGSIYVRIDNGYELGELHDVVDTTTTSSYGDLLVKSGSVWINSKQLTGSYAITGSLIATSFTGSLLGTASFASTASFINVTGSNAFVQGGNSFGTSALLGTNDNQSLSLETSGSVRMFISSSGIVGVRTTNPEATFDVSGSVRANGSLTFATDGSGGNGMSFSRTGNNSWVWGTSGIGNVLGIFGNTTYFYQVVYPQNGLYVTPGGNSPSQALGVTVGSYPTATLATFSSGSVTALTISGSGMRGTGSFNYSGSVIADNITARQNVTASRVYISSSNGTVNGSSLTVYGSGSAQPVLTVQGSQGELFSITDSLSGSLYSVNDISGLPILEVFSDNTVLIGNYQDPMLITTTKLVTTASGAFTLYSLPTASYDTAFFEYSIKSGSNARAGSIMAIQSGTSVNFTETTTTDFGSTAGFNFTVQVAGANMILTGSATTTGWTIKTIVRSI